LPTKAICCRIFTPALPDCPAASLRDFLSGAYNHEEQIILVLPEGWVFHEAENASGFAKGLGAIKFELNGRHSSLAHIAWNQNGLLHTYDEYNLKFGRP